ncbi:MAG: hypothetical protein MJZ25_13405 [Fibrobacter sp.]|nr:hypothetical protein [Fibrobacter sp.]
MNKVISLVLIAVAFAFGAHDTLDVYAPSIRDFGKAGIWYGTDAKGPVTVWFHGGMTSNNCEKGLVAGNDIAKLLPEHSIVSASACKNSHWVSRQGIEWVDAALDSLAVRRKAPVDSVYLIGVSDGALGVITYTTWGRRSPIAQVLISSYGPSMGNAQNVAEQPKLRRGRWRFIQGGSDRLYPFKETVPWIASFCKNIGTECDMKFDQRGEHDWNYWQNKHKDWILDIFFSKPLTKVR